MSLQSEAMFSDGRERMIVATPYEEGWRACEFVNHPKPSGVCRWLATYEDNRHWSDRVTAVVALARTLWFLRNSPPEDRTDERQEAPAGGPRPSEG